MGPRPSSDTLLRQWTMLRRIPRVPRRIITADLQSALASEEHKVTARTIQRDLEKLSAVSKLVSSSPAKAEDFVVETNLETEAGPRSSAIFYYAECNHPLLPSRPNRSIAGA